MRSKVMNFLRKNQNFKLTMLEIAVIVTKLIKFLVLDNISWGNNFLQDLNPLDFHIWGAMLEKYQAYVSKPINVTEQKSYSKQSDTTYHKSSLRTQS